MHSYPELQINAEALNKIPWHSRPVGRSPPGQQRRRRTITTSCLSSENVRRSPSLKSERASPANMTTPPACWTTSMDRCTPLRRTSAPSPLNVRSTPPRSSPETPSYRPSTGFTWVSEEQDKYAYLTMPSHAPASQNIVPMQNAPPRSLRESTGDLQILAPQPVRVQPVRAEAVAGQNHATQSRFVSYKPKPQPVQPSSLSSQLPLTSLSSHAGFDAGVDIPRWKAAEERVERIHSHYGNKPDEVLPVRATDEISFRTAHSVKMANSKRFRRVTFSDVNQVISIPRSR